ncbi:MAG: nidogen-like domain-containing protein, partial [Gemmataceae bacterium]
MKTLPRRPRLEPLEDRQTPADVGAVRDPAGFSPAALDRGDEDVSGLTPLGFDVNFLGSVHSGVFVHTNGVLTFTAPLVAYRPAPLDTLGLDVIAPLFADADTRSPASGTVLFGTGTVGGRPAFVATWDGVGYFDAMADRLDRFQVVLVGRDDLAPGDFDLELNYHQIQWDEAQSSPPGEVA